MSILFTSGNIGSLTLKNRFVRSATSERMAGLDGSANEQLVEFYSNLAKGGVGLIITGHTFVNISGRANFGQMGFDADDKILPLKRLVKEVHKYDAAIFIQLAHAGRQTKSKYIEGKAPIAPSAVEERATHTVPRRMSGEEIEETIESFGKAASRAQEAGFDGVQLHCAHGYLISEFLSPHTNRRNDEWGGSLEKRMRFLLEAYKSVRKNTNEDFPVAVKLNAEDFVEGGLEIEESIESAKILSSEGIAAIEISGGTFESSGKIIQKDIVSEKKEAYFLTYAEKITKAIDNPVICVGGFRTKNLMEQAIEAGKADFISMSRPFIREPDLVNKFKKGKQRADCISCNNCMNPRVRPIRCVVGKSQVLSHKSHTSHK